MSSASTSSVELPATANRYTDSLWYHPDKPEEEKDWLKIGAIVAAVVGALIAAVPAACFYGIFPKEILGGTIGAGITLIIGASILLPGAMILIQKYFFEKEEKTP